MPFSTSGSRSKNRNLLGVNDFNLEMVSNDKLQNIIHRMDSHAGRWTDQ
jgi:hypothetical protein